MKKFFDITHEQISSKAFEISKANPEHSSEQNWNEAKKKLKYEQIYGLFIHFWRWTGFADKKLWDILQLIIVPGIFLYTGLTIQNFIKNENDNNDRLLAKEKADQDLLYKYQHQMEELLRSNLLNEKIGSPIFIVAQSKTIYAIKTLNFNKQVDIINFLHNTSLNNLDGGKGILYKAPLSGINLEKSDFSAANFKDASFREANLKGTDFSGANLSGADFSGADLRDVDFSGASLQKAILIGAKLNSAKLIGANLDGANLKGSEFISAELLSSNLSNVIAIDSDFTRSNLSNVVFHGADLMATKLNDADITGGNFLTVRNLSLKQLKFAKNRQQAKLRPEFHQN